MNMRLVVPKPSWPLSAPGEDLRVSRRVSHLPLSSRFQDAREKVRLDYDRWLFPHPSYSPTIFP